MVIYLIAKLAHYDIKGDNTSEITRLKPDILYSNTYGIRWSDWPSSLSL